MDDRLESMYRRFTWRMLSNYVTPWEFEQLRAEITDYEQWCGAWSRHAREHLARGDEALAAGRRLTAGEAYLRGALAYHWASFVFTHDQAQFRAALEAMAGAWARAAPLLSPPMEILAVRFGNITLHGYLRLPPGTGSASTGPAPIVLLLPGADSGKQAVFNLGEHIVPRALEVGAVYEGVLFAIRTAAADHRVRAVFAMSSWYTPAGRFAAMDDLTRPGQYQHHGPDPAAKVAAITLAGVADRATVPLLQVYGGDDPGSPPSHAERIAAEYGGPVT